MSFAEYVVLLQRRWRIWTATSLAGVLIALGFNAYSPPEYTAVATSFVTVADTANSGPGAIFQGSQFAVQRMASYSALSSSPDVLNPVIAKLDLDVPLRQFREMVDVTSPADSVLLKVSVKDSDRERAAATADEVSKQLGLLIEELETPRGRAASWVKVTLTQPAEVPLLPSSPRVFLNLLLGLIGGAALGLLISLLRHSLDRRIKTAHDIEAITNMASLGSTVFSRAARRQPLVAMNYRSVGAERYRTIRTALKFVDVDHQLRHFVVSSPMPGDGKTSVASNLAISWAQAGANVCLVDAGLRKPVISRVFDVSGTAGLSDVLVGDVKLDEVLTSWNNGMLTILPAGSLPPDPTAMLGSEAMAHLVANLKTRYDIVIYDSDPMMAVTDAAVLSRLVDGLVLVIRSGSTTRDHLSACLETVRKTRLTLLGTVLFGVKLRGSALRPYYPVDFDWRRTVLPDRWETKVSPPS